MSKLVPFSFLWFPLSFLLVVVVLGGCKTNHRAHPHRPHHAASEHAGAHHDFAGAEAWAKRFDDPARDAWQRPEIVLERLQLEDGLRVADIGAGTGYFAVRLARALPKGRVYGIDIEPDMVRYLRDRATREGLENLESQHGLPEDPLLPNDLDRILVVDTYHHISDRSDYFDRVAKQLAPGGRIAIVDFKMGKLPVGPPDAMKIAPDRIIEEMATAGYAIETDDRESLPHQVILVFGRSAR